ncbi:MAG: ABC transporter permease [Silvibacterium sp.]
MGNLLQDLRFAFRQLRKAPSFAVTAILTLALGIGANTAVFSLVNFILLKPLPVPHAEQLMTLVWRQNSGVIQNIFSLPEFKAIRVQSGRSFSNVVAYTVSLDGFSAMGQQPQRILTSYVSGNFFSGLGLTPAAGRLFGPSEGEVMGSDPVIVLGYQYWQQKFNGDPNIVGRAVTFDGHPMTVVGVAPKGFGGLQQSFVSMDAYLPLSELTVTGTPADVLNDWQNRIVIVNALLRPGTTLGRANTELSLVANSIMRQHPDIEKQLDIEAFPEPSVRINLGNPRTMYVIAGLFLALAVMVLLLACVNVANLVLVRATAREREMAIRSALGAARARLFAQTITESVLLALMGGAAGVVLGMWVSSMLSHLNLHAPIPIVLAFSFDWRIFLYSFLIASLAGLVVGMVPALRIARANVSTVLHEGGRGVTAGRHWVRDGLVALQIAASLVLLVVASLFTRSLTAMETMDFGFNPDHVLNFVIDSNEVGMTAEQGRDLVANLTARLHQFAGVESVSHATSIPFGYYGSGSQIIVDGAPLPANPADAAANYNVVSPEYFSVMGIPLLRGRAFTTADNAQSTDVAIVSESTARKFWPGQDALGRTFRMTSEKRRKLEVVAIARDAEFQLFFGGKQAPYFYIPYAQHVAGNTLMVFQLRTAQDPEALIPAAEPAVHELAPQLPIFQVQTMRQSLYTLNGLLLFQIGATMTGIMGGLGLTLALIGLYGVVSYAVSRRVHEIGLRMALGASRGGVFRMIYRQSLAMIAAGLGIGLAVALLMAKAVGQFVVVSAWDPATFATVAAVLALAALGSCYPPARRAMTVEPMVALREE